MLDRRSQFWWWVGALGMALDGGSPSAQGFGGPLHLDPDFHPSLTTTRGAVLYAVALQPDGRIVVGGQFGLVNGTPRRGLARVHSDGTLDESFDAGEGVRGTVYDLAIQLADGRVLVAGQMEAVGGAPRPGIARLEPDGRLDPEFRPAFAGAEGWFVNALLVLPDGRIVAGGQFQSVDGRPRDGVVRLLPDGRVDADFNPGGGLAGGTAYDVALQADGRLLVGGAFATMDGVFSPGVVRLLPDGRVDTTFIGGVFNGAGWGRVFALSIQPGLGVVVAGEFDTVDLEVRQRIARLQFDGSLDPTFDPQQGVDGGEQAVLDLAVLESGTVVLTGSFASAAGVERSSLAGLDTTGSADPAFDPGPGLELVGPGVGSMLAVQPDGRIVAVGQFQTAAGTRRHCLARFLPDGTLDETFSTTNAFLEFPGTIRVLEPLPGGGWLAGGEFERVDGIEREALVRLDAQGRPDPGFHAGLPPGSVVQALASDAVGRWVVGGDFETVQGFEQRHLTRLQADGTRDESFLSVGPDAPVRAVLIDPSGGMVVAGEFIRWDWFRRLGMARLTEEGEVDAAFDVRFEMDLDDPVVGALAWHTDGALVAGGRFSRVNGEAQPHLVRIAPDGSLDASFARDLRWKAESGVRALAPTANGRLVLGGDFGLQTGGFLNAVARLRSDGSPDTGFRVGTGVTGHPYPEVNAVASLPDGRVALGGRFTACAGVPALNFAFTDSRGTVLAGGETGSGLDGPVTVLRARGTDELLVGGPFHLMNGATRIGLARFTVAAPGPEFYVEVTRERDGTVTVEWEGPRVLEFSAEPAGPWTSLLDATSPYHPDPGAPSGYYRLRQP